VSQFTKFAVTAVDTALFSKLKPQALPLW